jgi:hypothetical protein
MRMSILQRVVATNSSGLHHQTKIKTGTKTYMGGAAALLCSISIYWIFGSWFSAPVDLSRLSNDQWRSDFRYLAEQLPLKHANAFHYVSRENFDQLAAKVDLLIQKGDARDNPFQFLRLTAVIGDGHTSVSTSLLPGRYPVRFYWFGDELRVIRALPAAQEALGLRLSAIDGTPIKEVATRLREMISQDENRWYFLNMSPLLIIRPGALHALGIVKETQQARFTFEKDNGETFDLTFGPAGDGQNDWREAYTAPPLYLAHRDDGFWFTAFPETKTVYVVFNKYDWLLLHSWKLFRYLDSHPTERLVIDMRQNGGGDYNEGHRWLIAQILRRPSLNRRGHLFVVTGRATFSAAMSNAAQFRTETNATLIGEPPGEVPNSYQEHRSFVLPNSHLQVNYAVRYYKFLPADAPALLPDQDVAPDWKSYREGTDPVLAGLGINRTN